MNNRLSVGSKWMAIHMAQLVLCQTSAEVHYIFLQQLAYILSAGEWKRKSQVTLCTYLIQLNDIQTVADKRSLLIKRADTIWICRYDWCKAGNSLLFNLVIVLVLVIILTSVIRQAYFHLYWNGSETIYHKEGLVLVDLVQYVQPRTHSWYNAYGFDIKTPHGVNINKLQCIIFSWLTLLFSHRTGPWQR
jgi:hypothetical protein